MKRFEPPATPNAPRSSPAVAVVEITDPTAVGEDVRVIEQDVVQLAANPLRARRVMVRLGTSVLLFQSTNLSLRTRTTLHGGLVAYVVFGPSASGTLNGVPVGPDRILASASGIEAEFVVAAGYESVSFLVPPDEVREHLRLRQRDCGSVLPHGVELLQTSPGAGRRLFDWGRRVADAAAKHPEIFDRPETNAVTQSELIEVLLTSVASVTEAEQAPRDSTRRAYSRIVRIAEDHALKHPGEPLYVADLCKAASVSERTLQNAFKEVLGMTPVTYLTRLRLHRVRRAMRTSTPDSTTVTNEAMKWGFWHLGEFSRAYNDCFGELPSTTLRRRQ